jgi:2Fe-2S ferredoxin
MLKWLFSKKKMKRTGEAGSLSEETAAFDSVNGPFIELKGRTVLRKAKPIVGVSILELADKSGVDWNSHCKRGTCARCRCHVSEGKEYLSEPNEAETARLTAEEIEGGYRLGCQAKISAAGNVKVRHAPYF